MEELSQLNQFLNDVSVEQKKARIEAAKIQKMKEVAMGTTIKLLKSTLDMEHGKLNRSLIG